jgi:hypothetical protein
MASTSTQDDLRLSPAIPRLLDTLRLRIRQYVWLEGVTSAIAWLGTAFWITLAIDWFFEPSRTVRGLLLAAVGAVLAVVLYRLILRRAFVRFSDDNMAMLLERRFPKLDESLLTAVELVERRDHAEPFNRQMLAQTCVEAEQRVAEVHVARVFNPVPLRRSILAAVLLAVSVGLFGGMFPSALGMWAKRTLAFSDEIWPRRTKLFVVGFEEGQPVKVAKGADLEVVARVNIQESTLVPQSVHVVGRTDDGARVRATMNRVGNADPEKEDFQEYSYAFQGVLSPIRFSLHGGDAWIEDLRIEVVENPTIVDLELEYRYPKYTGLSSKTVGVTGVMQVPKGTELTIHAKANKELVRARVDSALADKSTPQTIEIGESAEDRTRFQYAIRSLEEDTALLFTLFDTDGIKSREPVRLALAAVADEAPKLDVRLRGIGPAVTPQARIPAAGRIEDDYGIARTWFEYAIDKEKPQESGAAVLAAHPLKHELDAAVEARDLKIQPGQKLALELKAADRCDRGKGPNVGATERWLLDVVTPQQLQTMLESRELVLRQRFEVIIREVEDTRELLARIEFIPSPAGKSANNVKEKKEKDNSAAGGANEGPGKKDDTKKDGGGEKKEGEKPVMRPEPGDEPEGEVVRTPEQIRTRATLAAQRASQNASKNQQEVLGVAEAFDDIREELINNRIDSEKLRTRLKQGIADPLRHIGQELFPRLEHGPLADLEANIEKPETGARDRLLAIQQLDVILSQMRQVLQQMLELETFNEAVAQLRAIIQSQEKLNEEIKKRHKEKLRDLLE